MAEQGGSRTQIAVGDLLVDQIQGPTQRLVDPVADRYQPGPSAGVEFGFEPHMVVDGISMPAF